MSKATKIWLIVAAALVASGIIMFGLVMTMLNWDFLKLGTSKYETNRYEIDESFNDISIKTDTSDIAFLPSEDGKIKVVCYEQAKTKHSVSVENDTLIINLLDNRKWYDFIGITFWSTKMTVYLPEGEYGKLNVKVSTGEVEISENYKFESVDITATTGNVKSSASTSDFLKIKTGTGHITLGDISAKSMDLSVTTGDIDVSNLECEGEVKIKVTTGKTKLTNVQCKDLVSSGSTGDITMTNMIVSGKLDIERSTGDIKFESCDSGEIFIETDTGDVKGSLLSGKIFVVNTDTGKKDVPKTTSGGVCEITTDTGDIIINIK